MNEDRYLNSDFVPLCPICGRELTKMDIVSRGWECKCGEFIPTGLQVSPRVQPSKGAVLGAETAPAVSEKAALKGRMVGY